MQNNNALQMAIDALESLMSNYSFDIERAIEIMAALGRNCDPASSMITQTKRVTEYDKTLAALRQHQQDGGWLPIETAPETNGKYFFCQIAWGEEGDEKTGRGFRWNGRWFVGATFYKGGRFDECQYELRQIEVMPTLWQPLPPDPKKENDDE